MPTTLFLEQILNGVVLGSMYALFASGLTLIWGVMKMLNFAHGDYFMLGGYLVYFLVTLLGVPPVVGILVTIAGIFFMGLVSERLVIQPLLHKPEWGLSTLIATLGIHIFLQNFVLKVCGERFKHVNYYIESTFEVFGLRIAGQRLMILAVAIVVMVAYWIFLKKSRYGLALRATSQDREAATLIGINFYGIYLMTFGISSALAALSATMLAPIFSINPWMGVPSLMKAFVVAVLGGLGSVGGAILAGLVLGMAESLSTIIFSSEWKELISFAVLVIVLSTRPEGFFGKKEW